MNIEIVKQILASDIISWIFAAIGGALAYLVLHRMQNTRERHCMIKEIEDTISQLMDKKSALKRKVITESDMVQVNMRTVLHDFTPWVSYNKDNTITIDDQRFVLIRNDDENYERIGTSLLHETLLWFRRVNKLYKDRIIIDEDLADLWHEILPFMRANKLEFYRSYFGAEDTYPIMSVCIHCMNACHKFNRITAIDYIKEIIKEIDLEQYLKEMDSKCLKKANRLCKCD